MLIKKQLSTIFHIQPGEGQPVSLLLLYYFLLGGAFNFVQTAAFSLFLVEFNAQTLAYVYIANALVVPLITTVYLRLGRRISFPMLLAVNLGFLLVLVIAFWIGLGISGTSWFVFALPILFQILVNLGNLSFWPLAGRLFNVRQSKRLFGLVGAGQWIAIVLTGFLIPSLVSWIGTVNLLILGAASLIGALITNRYITRLYATTLNTPLEHPTDIRTRQGKSGQATSLLRSRYVILIFVLVFLWWLAFFFLDNLFYAVAAIQYPDAQALASFLGLFLGGLGIITLICNFFLTGPVISRFGLQTSLLILPVFLVVGTGSMALLVALGIAATLLFWLAISNKLLDMALGFSIDRTAQTILYQPLPSGLRMQVQTMAEGVVQPLANGAAGLGLLALGALFASYTTPLILGVLVIVVAWALTAYRLGREYPKTISTGAHQTPPGRYSVPGLRCIQPGCTDRRSEQPTTRICHLRSEHPGIDRPKADGGRPAKYAAPPGDGGAPGCAPAYRTPGSGQRSTSCKRNTAEGSFTSHSGCSSTDISCSWKKQRLS